MNDLQDLKRRVNQLEQTLHNLDLYRRSWLEAVEDRLQRLELLHSPVHHPEELRRELEGLRNDVREVTQLARAILKKEVRELAAIDDLKTAVDAVNKGIDDETTSINDLATRLSNNPTAADVAAVATALGDSATRLTALKSQTDLIDPATPGPINPSTTIDTPPAP